LPLRYGTPAGQGSAPKNRNAHRVPLSSTRLLSVPEALAGIIGGRRPNPRGYHARLARLKRTDKVRVHEPGVLRTAACSLSLRKALFFGRVEISTSSS